MRTYTIHYYKTKQEKENYLNPDFLEVIEAEDLDDAERITTEKLRDSEYLEAYIWLHLNSNKDGVSDIRITNGPKNKVNWISGR
jgi:hypothetical protein